MATSRLGSIMNIGQGSMHNSKTALQTVSHNVSNKETEGYSRQRTENFSNFPHGHGKRRLGTGARAVRISRTVNPYIEKQLAAEMEDLAFSKGMAEGLSSLENVYNELAVEGLNVSMVNFFNSFRELSTNPESMAKRVSVKEHADLLARDFNRISGQLDDAGKGANAAIAIAVQEVNAKTDEIARLNMQIQRVEMGGGYANDERDRRDLLLKQLGELIDIKWSEGPDHDITISSSNNAVLVVNGDARRLEAIPTPQVGNKAAGDYDILYYHHDYSDPIVLTDRIEGGRIGGLLAARDGEVKKYKDSLNMMALAISDSVNELHEQGYNAFNTRGTHFFNRLDRQEDAAALFSVNPEIIGDVGQIAAGMDPDRPGDNRLAVILGDLQHQKALFDGETSIDEYYNGLIAELGLRTNKINRDVEIQEGIVSQLKNLRESISGVSIDEEMAQMMEWQKQFDASARIITTADEMFGTVLAMKR